MAGRGVVALTGATGFVGRATLDRLIEAGWHVRALTRRSQQARPGITWVEGALDRPESLAELCEGAEAVLHIAGVVNAPDAAGFEAGNVMGTANLLNAARELGISRFVHVSSLSAREPQLSVYGASKAKGEKLVATSMLDWTIIRPPGVYGPGDTEVLEMFKMAARGFCLLPPAGKGSWIHVDDLARLLVVLLPRHEDATARLFEADDDEPGGWEHRRFARAIGWALGRRVATIAAPRPLLFAAAWGDRMVRGAKAKLTPDRASYMSHPDWVISRDAAPPAALWTPLIDTREGLKQTARWYKAEGWL
ncbi:MAG: NAD(P)-dependent oxidoreductase [Sphingomonadales bacterium]|jgi:nucleoside-diphosphate-sugar epimerase|nr:NAD(P)-dependent oxidoreductase [Sphingomonadales bacterium]MBK9267173.1 NAD(P)-dependent oxidoreductase [Sphingomonadales bacterium]MBP6433485.1 NAD(P)-dependent oxidoreductase [Sphingorhabdus sp.]